MTTDPTDTDGVPASDSPKTAKILILAHGTPAKGFTFAKGGTVEDVPLKHAEYLEAGGKAKILEVN